MWRTSLYSMSVWVPDALWVWLLVSSKSRDVSLLFIEIDSNAFFISKISTFSTFCSLRFSPMSS